eukprot:2668228-Alexandrium_andersonii.AAC.1
MSASLVGSEMCIRDRKSSARGRGGRGSAAGCRSPSTRGECPIKGRLVPVSYTHLTLPTICSV